MTTFNNPPQIDVMDGLGKATNEANHTIHTQQLKRWQDEHCKETLIVGALKEYAACVARMDSIFKLSRKDSRNTLFKKHDRSEWLKNTLNTNRQECDGAYRYLVLITNTIIAKDANPQAWATFVEKVNEDIRFHRQHTLAVIR